MLAPSVAMFRRELTVDRHQGEKQSVVYSWAGHPSSNRLAMLVVMAVNKVYLSTMTTSKAYSITVGVGMNSQAC